MATVGNLVARLTAHTQPFERGMMRSGRSTQAFATQTATSATVVQGAVGRMQASFAGLATAIPAMLGIAGAGMAISSITRRIEDMDTAIKAARKVQMDVDAFRQLGHVAELAGTSTQSLSYAMERLQRELGAAQQGAGPAAEALGSLGLSAQRLAQMAPDARMMLLADALRAVEDETQRSALAYKLFGRRGAEMLLILDQGSAAMREQMEAAAALQGSLKGHEDQIEATADSLTRFRAIASEVGNTLAIGAANAVEWLRANSLIHHWATQGWRPETEVVGLAPEAEARMQAIEQAQRDAAAAAAQHAEAQRQLAEAVETARKPVDDFLSRLEDQAAIARGVDPLVLQIERMAQGMADLPVHVVEQWRREMHGAAAELRRIERQQEAVEEAARKATDQQREAERQMESMRRRAESLAAAVRSPFEELVDSLTEFRELLSRGLLDEEIFRRLVDQAKQQFAAAGSDFHSPFQAARGAELGSMEAARSILQFQRGDQPREDRRQREMFIAALRESGVVPILQEIERKTQPLEMARRP